MYVQIKNNIIIQHVLVTIAPSLGRRLIQVTHVASVFRLRLLDEYGGSDTGRSLSWRVPASPLGLPSPDDNFSSLLFLFICRCSHVNRPPPILDLIAASLGFSCTQCLISYLEVQFSHLTFALSHRHNTPSTGDCFGVA